MNSPAPLRKVPLTKTIRITREVYKILQERARSGGIPVSRYLDFQVRKILREEAKKNVEGEGCGG